MFLVQLLLITFTVKQSIYTKSFFAFTEIYSSISFVLLRDKRDLRRSPGRRAVTPRFLWFVHFLTSCIQSCKDAWHFDSMGVGCKKRRLCSWAFLSRHHQCLIANLECANVMIRAPLLTGLWSYRLIIRYAGQDLSAFSTCQIQSAFQERPRVCK